MWPCQNLAHQIELLSYSLNRVEVGVLEQRKHYGMQYMQEVA